jgi:polar amino acid transport system substrate-binding protein
MERFDGSDPIYRKTILVWVKAGHGFPFSGGVDLRGKRVGINRGVSYGEVFDSARRAGLFGEASPRPAARRLQCNVK